MRRVSLPQADTPVRKAGIDLDEIRARIQGGQCVIGADDAADSDDGTSGPSANAIAG